MTRKHFVALALVVFSLLRWHAAVAGQSSMSCEPDRKKHCADVSFGGGRVMQCLYQHESELSAGCKQQLATAAEKSGTKPECRADAAKLCNSATGNPAKMTTCMQEHTAELSAGCRAVLNASGK